MATNPGISIGFSRYNEGDLELKTKEIIAGLTGNPAFPDPEPLLPTVQNALAAYSEARVIAAAVSHAAVIAKDSSREALQKLLVQLGLWVMATAKGNADAWASSGFKLKKRPSQGNYPVQAWLQLAMVLAVAAKGKNKSCKWRCRLPV